MITNNIQMLLVENHFQQRAKWEIHFCEMDTDPENSVASASFHDHEVALRAFELRMDDTPASRSEAELSLA